MISASRIEFIFSDSLAKKSDTNCIEVQGITGIARFNLDILSFFKEEVKSYLLQLPNQFLSERMGGKGGWSFLNACMTEKNEHWGEHMDMQRLFLLGEALGYVRCPLPKQMWTALPGGMPYYTVDIV